MSKVPHDSLKISHQQPLGKKNIFFFYPNILGYARIILVLIATHSAFESWKTLSICYCVSQILDAADGYVARYLNQATLFGSVLDQVTDRLSTVSILILDSIVHSRYYFLFTVVLILDLSGHWIHTFASLSAGRKSHKNIPKTWPLLRLYYEHRVLMFLCHAGNEFVWLALFILTQITSNTLLSSLLLWSLIPASLLCFLKNITNVAQLIFGAQVLAATHGD